MSKKNKSKKKCKYSIRVDIRTVYDTYTLGIEGKGKKNLRQDLNQCYQTRRKALTGKLDILHVGPNCTTAIRTKDIIDIQIQSAVD